MDLAFKFRSKCKDLKESEMLVLCAEPGKNPFVFCDIHFYIVIFFLDSRQAFLDRLDEVTESEVL